MDKFIHSSFSEEDITSDLLGFYGAVWETRGPRVNGRQLPPLSREAVVERIKELCKVVGLHDDPATYYQKQRDIYWRYVIGRPVSGLPTVFDKLLSIPSIGFQDVFEWGRPRLADIDSGWCTKYCSEPDRGFPQEFQEFIPNHGGFWRWVSGYAELHIPRYMYHEYTMEELNNRNPHLD